MTRGLVIALVASSSVLAASPLSGRRQQSPQQSPVFRAQASAVSVDVSVRDKNRRPITDLKAADFVVQDNGIDQTVAEISYAKRPIDVTVGFDVSGSVTAAMLDQLLQGVSDLTHDLRDVDRLKLMLFNNQFTRVIDFNADTQAFGSAMRGVPAGGATALFDAAATALVAARDPERRQLVVFFTDGVDTTSITTPTLLQTIAERTRATFTIVASAPPGPVITMQAPLTPLKPGSSGEPVQPQQIQTRAKSIEYGVLGRIAQDTGGDLLRADSATLGAVLRQALDNFRSSYVLFYSPTGVDRAGFHTITVRVSRPDTVVQARRGYFGG